MTACCLFGTKPVAAGRMKKNHATLVGKRFGKLTVEKILGPDRWRSIRARCVCDCGNVKRVVVSRLIKDEVIACGKGVCHGSIRDISGRKFAYLTAESADRTEILGTFWWFFCECGRRVSLNRNAVVAGKQKSCGCMLASLVSRSMRNRFPPEQAVINRAYGQHVRDAQKRSLLPCLSKDEWTSVAKQPCYYCGHTSKRLTTYGLAVAMNSVDRLNNESFYRVGVNAVPCCFRCQRIKMHFTAQEFIDHSRVVVARADSLLKG